MIIPSTAEAIISRLSCCLGILQFLQCSFVCNLHCSTSQLDHPLVLEMAKHSSDYLPELAAEIAPDWDLPTEAVQSGLETLRSHLELVQGDAALLYEMT